MVKGVGKGARVESGGPLQGNKQPVNEKTEERANEVNDATQSTFNKIKQSFSPQHKHPKLNGRVTIGEIK